MERMEERSVNLDCVKKELGDEFDENEYICDFNLENLIEQRNNADSLIGFSDGDVVMKIETYCDTCGRDYDRYCLNCSSLSHILNNLTPNINPQLDLNTVPVKIFEIEDFLETQGVFVSKTIPRGVTLGPFEGVTPVQSTAGLRWKIEKGKFINDQNSNWLKYIASIADHSLKNLDVFQLNGKIFFETTKEIEEGDQLLAYYGAEDDGKGFYLNPVQKEEYAKIFACTLCCLGFSVEKCLVEHNSKCPQKDRGGSIPDIEIIQCGCCKIWLEKQEHLKTHKQYCLDHFNRLNSNISDSLRETTQEIEETERSGENRSSTIQAEVICLGEKNYKCSECSFQTDHEGSLEEHLNTHKDVKSFECDVCQEKFRQKDNLKRHIINQHSNANKEILKCSKCSYQTNNKSSLKAHFNTHIKPFECDICKLRFSVKTRLKYHVKDRHSNTEEKDYKCSQCSYKTNRKDCLVKHLNTHNDVKSFECDVCKKKFNSKINLQVHIRNQHSNTNKKKYKCSECSYQTNRKDRIDAHLNSHKGIKKYECNICKKKLAENQNLKLHIKNYHSNTNEKEHKCSKCSYQTNYESNLKAHLDRHLKPFKCTICKLRFSRKTRLKYHLNNQHYNTEEKEYKCSKCSYQTSHKGTLTIHMNIHNDIKPFQCDICKNRFRQKKNLKHHVRNQHSNTNEKKYKCSKCSYQTYNENSLTAHLNKHNDVKKFECDVCKMRSNCKRSLRAHIIDQHSNTSEKKYKCPDCPYQTNRRYSLGSHINTHKGIKPFECDMCKKRFVQKSNLNVHIKNLHSSTMDKEYKCSKCLFQTNRKDRLANHLSTHKKFNNNPQHHMKNHDLNANEKKNVNASSV